MSVKPVLTYYGSGPLFRSLENHILSSISLDTCEWRRSYGRPTKNVRLEACFKPFSPALLENYKKGEWSILEHPIMHIFVTECNDVDTYKSTTKEEIDTWMKILVSYGVNDWMILVVETLDVRKTKNLLPRTTVLDKIRLDFASKNGDRCISILHPIKFEQKSTESFRCLIQRIRFFMLCAYNKIITKYEELVRSNRDKRNHEGWSFLNYFLIQEDLALVLENLELHSEALVQYDELEAMFSQFIINSIFGGAHKWLEVFKSPLTSFYGINLCRADEFYTRKKICDGSLNLLEFRNYIYERQCHLLLRCEKPFEVAERLLPFLFSTLREIEILKVNAPDGALWCWEFICSLEVLEVCDNAIGTKEMSCFQHCAPIWNLAKDKLYDLGKLCGLIPGFTPSSEQLHIVVQLSAGIDDPPTEKLLLDPTSQTNSSYKKLKKGSAEKLKEALGSNQNFEKLILELSELAISTYKHVSRLRFARLVGLDLGNFYCLLNQPQKAVVFFTELLRELKFEKWHCLASQTLLEIAKCYHKMDDLLSYTKTCSAISCCVDLDILVRTFYFDEFLKSLTNLSCIENNYNHAVFEDHFKIIDINIMNTLPIIQDNTITIVLYLESNFPREILVDKVYVSYEPYSKETSDKSIIKASNNSNESFYRLNATLHLDYKQDHTLSCASVACENLKNRIVNRKSSSRKVLSTVRPNFNNGLCSNSVMIKPGENKIQLSSKATRTGIWILKQLAINISHIEFLSKNIPLQSTQYFEVTTKQPSAVLKYKDLIAGIEQKIQLIISTGSFMFPSDAKIVLKCSNNLYVRQSNNTTNNFEDTIEIYLQNLKCFEERIFSLIVITDLPGRNVEKYIEHKIFLTCPWSRNEIQLSLLFMPALTASCRLHTCGTQKFLQVCVKGVGVHLYLFKAAMRCDVKGVSLIDLNLKKNSKIEIYKNLTVSYLWELQVEPLKTETELSLIKVNFSIQYSNYNKPDLFRNYACAFDVMDYTTIFKIQSRLEPTELCRVGSVCNLNLKIIKLQESPFLELMYEVLPDQNMWAICGRSAGVISMKDAESQLISLDILPLTAGFLPLPNIRLSKYISVEKGKHDNQPKLQPFPPGQVYNSTKSIQIHVLASSNNE